jgi:hypothetical protein
MNRDRLLRAQRTLKRVFMYGKKIMCVCVRCAEGAERRRLRCGVRYGAVPARAHLPIRIKIIAFSLPSRSGECAKVNLNYKALHPAGQYNEYAALKLSADNKNITLV